MLLNSTGDAISWRQRGQYRSLADGDTVEVNVDRRFMIKLDGYTRPLSINLGMLSTEVVDGDTVYRLTVDDIPVPDSVVNVRNMVPYRIGVSIDGGPVFVSGDEIISVVAPGVGAGMRFHYPGDISSEQIELPPGERIKFMIAIPRVRSSPLAGTWVSPQSTIDETVYAYTIACDNRLTYKQVVRTGEYYVYILDEAAPRLPFSPNTAPDYWSYDGPVEPGPATGEPLIPARVRVTRESVPSTPTPAPPKTPPAPEANRSYLFWLILGGIGLIALIGLGGLFYWLATRSSGEVTVVDAADMDFPETVIL